MNRKTRAAPADVRSTTITPRSSVCPGMATVHVERLLRLPSRGPSFSGRARLPSGRPISVGGDSCLNLRVAGRVRAGVCFEVVFTASTKTRPGPFVLTFGRRCKIRESGFRALQEWHALIHTWQGKPRTVKRSPAARAHVGPDCSTHEPR